RDFHVTGVQTCALPISVEDLSRIRLVHRLQKPFAHHPSYDCQCLAIAEPHYRSFRPNPIFSFPDQYTGDFFAFPCVALSPASFQPNTAAFRRAGPWKIAPSACIPFCACAICVLAKRPSPLSRSWSTAHASVTTWPPATSPGTTEGYSPSLS